MDTQKEVKFRICEVCGKPSTNPNTRYYKSYPSPVCSHFSEKDIWNANGNGRQFRSRHGLTPKHILEESPALQPPLIERRPANPKEHPEFNWNEIVGAREALTSGKIDLARERARALRDLIADDPGSDAQRIRTQCEQVLLDAGATGDPEAVFQDLSKKALSIVKQYSLQRDPLSFAESLITYSNLERIHSDWLSDEERKNHHFRQALDAVQGALNHLVRERGRNKYNQELVTIAMHQALIWKTRLFIDYLEPAHKLHELQLLSDLADEIDSPRIRLETLRETVRCLICLGEIEEARAKIAVIKDQLERIQGYSVIAPMTMLRLEIDSCDPILERDKAARFLELYIALWRKYPLSYHVQQICRWAKRFRVQGIDQRDRVVSSSTPILACLYLEESWRKRI